VLIHSGFDIRNLLIDRRYYIQVLELVIKITLILHILIHILVAHIHGLLYLNFKPFLRCILLVKGS
jgi:hypothetical protein